MVRSAHFCPRPNKLDSSFGIIITGEGRGEDRSARPHRPRRLRASLPDRCDFGEEKPEAAAHGHVPALRVAREGPARPPAGINARQQEARVQLPARREPGEEKPHVDNHLKKTKTRACGRAEAQRQGRFVGRGGGRGRAEQAGGGRGQRRQAAAGGGGKGETGLGGGSSRSTGDGEGRLCNPAIVLGPDDDLARHLPPTRLKLPADHWAPCFGPLMGALISLLLFRSTKERTARGHAELCVSVNSPSRTRMSSAETVRRSRGRRAGGF